MYNLWFSTCYKRGHIEFNIDTVYFTYTMFRNTQTMSVNNVSKCDQSIIWTSFAWKIHLKYTSNVCMSTCSINCNTQEMQLKGHKNLLKLNISYYKFWFFFTNPSHTERRYKILERANSLKRVCISNRVFIYNT